MDRSEFWRAVFHTNLSPIDYGILGVLVAAISTWFKARIEKSVEHVYAQKLEDYKRELNRRDQAAKVAELLALVQSGTSEDIMKANQLSWEMSLWLPAKTAKGLAKHLAKLPDAPTHTKLLLDIRCILLSLEKQDLEEGDIATFPMPSQTGVGK